jgi:hypothetical protein
VVGDLDPRTVSENRGLAIVLIVLLAVAIFRLIAA